MTKPTFDKEQLLWKKGYKHVAGVDEVGRGCFAGPVVAAAVILPQEFPSLDQINDSKLLSPKLRHNLSEIIKKHALAYAISEVSVAIINKLGIGKATQLAFKNSVTKLSIQPNFILIDAFYIKSLKRKNQKAIIHGDGLSISIAAASILAKVHRDNRMQELHSQYSEYDFFTNKGYGTKKHQDAIRKYGFCDLHRKSFNLNKFL